jgi:hypothetical protein
VTYLNVSKIKKAIRYHQQYRYTYFITVTTNYKYHSTVEIFKKLKDYLHSHDRKSHIFSVKEFTTKAHGLHYHILYFTDKELNYSRLHKHMPPHSDIRIKIVTKTKKDIENVIKYMNKTKKCHKKKSKQMYENSKFQISIFDFKVSSGVIIKSQSFSNRNDSKLKVIPRLNLFDFQIDSKTKATIKSK